MNPVSPAAPYDLRDAFFETVHEEARRNPDLVLLTGDMAAFSLEQFRRELPAQVLNPGIAEQNLINLATGLALGGKQVIAYSIAPFILQRCYEQIKVNIADPGLPVTIAAIGPGITYANDGHSHHACQDIANARALPKMRILSPADPSGFREAGRAAGRTLGPLYLRLDKGCFPDLGGEPVPGVGRWLARGSQLLLLGTGLAARKLPDLVARLEARGFSVAALLVEQLKPVEAATWRNLLAPFPAVATLEEHFEEGGLGTLMAELLVGQSGAGLLRLGLPESVVDLLHGTREWMLQAMGLDVDSLEGRLVTFLEARSAARVGTTGRAASREGEILTLDLPRFAAVLGVPESAFGAEARALLEASDLRYREVLGPEREALLVEILQTIDSGTLTPSGPAKQAAWERGWAENLEAYRAQGHDPGALLPKFVRAGAVKRLQGAYIAPVDPGFETAFVRVQREVLFRKWFAEVETLHEFGCGTGHNLLAYGAMFPGRPMVGLDWAQASCALVDEIGRKEGLPLKGRPFDMFHPDPSLPLGSEDGVLTIGALEQLGPGFEPFLAFLLRKGPKVCLHLETLEELYDHGDLPDFAAIRYGRARNYLQGFLGRLRSLEREGRVEILQTQRTFGSQFHEGYSYVAWRPRREV